MRLLIAAALAASLTVAPHARGRGESLDALQDAATAAFERGDFGAARDALLKVVERKPDNAAVHYNLACALAQTGDLEGAAARLLDAVTWGFVDFHHMAADPHLEPLRASRDWSDLMLGWRGLLDARGDANLDSAKTAFGSGYRHEKDPKLRLIISAAFDEQTFAEARRDLEAVAEFAFEHVFADLALDDGADPRPDPWVSVILPTPEDFVRLVRAAHVGGFYDHDLRRLISQDAGPSLRHEFMHVLHWRDLARRGQRHADWVLEGLGCLVEDLHAPEGGRLAPVHSWRTNIVRRLARLNGLVPLRRFMTMPREQFMGGRPFAHYAQAQAVMLYLFERAKLRAWYAAYLDGFGADPSGVEAMERVFERPLEETEADFRGWARRLPESPETVEAGSASLGVVVGPGRGDGPEVEEVDRRPGRKAEPEDPKSGGLRVRDVITGLAGSTVRTTEDLVRALARLEPGDVVDVAVRRGTLRLTLRLRLVAASEDDR